MKTKQSLSTRMGHAKIWETSNNVRQLPERKQWNSPPRSITFQQRFSTDVEFYRTVSKCPSSLVRGSGSTRAEHVSSRNAPIEPAGPGSPRRYASSKERFTKKSVLSQRPKLQQNVSLCHLPRMSRRQGRTRLRFHVENGGYIRLDLSTIQIIR